MKELNMKPNVGTIYFYPQYMKFGLFTVERKMWQGSNVDRTLWEMHWVFLDKRNCISYCSKINKAIKEAM